MNRAAALVLAITAFGIASSPRAAPDPAAEPSTVDGPRKHYIGHSVAGCAVIDFGCPAGSIGFEDSHGCGCISPAAPAAKALKKPCPKPRPHP